LEAKQIFVLGLAVVENDLSILLGAIGFFAVASRNSAQ